jgi:hypothetical protein
MLDHLVYAVPNLEDTVAELERLTGVRPVFGGRHAGWGTHNALLALGQDEYLEIIAADPELSASSPATLFGLNCAHAPRLAAWAARADLEHVHANALGAGFRLGDIIAGRRQTADGSVLSWRMTDPEVVVGDGLVPFFIDWGESPHPAQSMTPSVRRIGFHGEHPEPEPIRRMLSALHIALHVESGPAPALTAQLETPRGVVLLR